MDKETKDNLSWFLDFAYTNTDQLSVSELIKLATDIKLFGLKGVLSNGFIENYTVHKITEAAFNNIKGHRTFDRVKELQVWFRKEFESILEKIHKFEPVFGGMERKGTPNKIFKIFDLLDEKPTVNLTVDAQIIALGEKQGGFERRAVASDWRENAKIIISTKIDKEEDYLFLEFLKALDGLSLNSLRQCDECGRWFLQTTKREKIYCSNPCAARKSNRDRRKKLKDEDSEAYEKELESNRLRAKKSYEKKIRKRSPGAVIGRKSQKKK